MRYTEIHSQNKREIVTLTVLRGGGRRNDIKHCEICNMHWPLFLCLKASPAFIPERQVPRSFITLSSYRDMTDRQPYVAHCGTCTMH